MSAPLGISLPDPLGLGGTIEKAAGAAASTILDVIADGIGTAVESVTAGIGTSWVRINTPALAGADGHASPVVQYLQSDIKWLVAAVAMLAILIGAGRAALDRSGERLGDVLEGIVVLTVVMGASAATVALLAAASDEIAQRIIDHALAGNDFGKHIALMLATGGPSTMVVGTIVLGFLAFIAAAIQLGLLAFRAGVLVVLVVLLPLAFSAYSTETGREWAKRVCAWVLAFALYKPVAALIYAASFRLVDGGTLSGSGIVKTIVGLMLMVVAILALPGLLRVVAPAVNAVHLRSGGGGSGALVAAAAMPTGAKFIAGGGQTFAQMSAAMPTGAVNASVPAPPTGANGAGPNGTVPPGSHQATPPNTDAPGGAQGA